MFYKETGVWVIPKNWENTRTEEISLVTLTAEVLLMPIIADSIDC